MDKNEFDNLGHGYQAPGNTLLYAISPRLGGHLAERFRALSCAWMGLASPLIR